MPIFPTVAVVVPDENQLALLDKPIESVMEVQ
jgi:hypothetical protein